MKSRFDEPYLCRQPLLMRCSLLLAVLLLVFAPGPASLHAQTAPNRTVGFELDALPYISGGYYGSVWFGVDHVRVRAVVTETTLPDFIVEDGFDNADLDVYAFIVDYMPSDGFQGLWVGAGLEYWENSIEHVESGATAEWDNTVATLGAGYVWKFAGDLYLNPWAAAHMIVAGETDIPVGGTNYEPNRVTPEASLKIGWHF